MADKNRMTIMVSGNKPRMRVRYEGEQLVVDCAKCFADFMRLCKWATDKKRNPDTGQIYQMPALEDANCQGFHGYATFPQDAYDVIVAHANRADGDPLIDIPLSLQGGVTTETPIATSQADIEKIAKKAANDAIAKYAAVQADPLDPALVGDDQEFGETEGNEPTLDEILDKELGPETPPMPDHEPEPPVIVSKRAKSLAQRHGIDLATLTPNAAGKITVVIVRKAVEATKK